MKMWHFRRRLLEDVRKLGRFPKEYSKPKTEDEVAEKKLCRQLQITLRELEQAERSKERAQIMLQELEASRVAKPLAASSTGGKHTWSRAASVVLQDVHEFVLEFNRLPTPIDSKKDTTDTKRIAESNLAYRMRNHKLQKQAQKILIQQLASLVCRQHLELKASSDTSGRSSSQAAYGNPITASGDLHSAVNPPHSAAS